jgi:YD repeat-containing protein
MGSPSTGGLVDREIDPTGRETRYEWHPAQYRKPAEIEGLGNRTEWAYDDRGNIVLERDALGRETRRRYDELRYTYDTEEDLLGVTNELGEEFRYYDPAAERSLRMAGTCHGLANKDDEAIFAWKEAVDLGATLEAGEREASTFSEVAVSLQKLLTRFGLTARAEHVRSLLAKRQDGNP